MERAAEGSGEVAEEVQRAARDVLRAVAELVAPRRQTLRAGLTGSR
jgi:hypothetical protein